MSTIITRNSANSGSVPSSLVQGELAINVTDNRLFFGSGSGNTVKEFGVTSSYALNALSASYARTASYALTSVTPSLQQVVNVGNSLVNFGGLGTASLLSVNFVNNRSLYLNDDSYPTIRLVDNNNASNNLQIDIDTISLDGVPYNWSDIVNSTASYALQALSASYAETSSYAPDYLPLTGGIISGNLYQLGTFYPDQIDWFSSSIGYNTGSYILTTTINGLTTYANYQDVANTLAPYIPTVSSSISASYAQTASYAPDYLPLTGGTINGNVIVNGTASIAFLNVTYESASVIYSSGSNQFGDALNDVQTLWGTVDIKTGPVLVTGSLNVSGGITGSLFGTASYANYATSASHALTASYVNPLRQIVQITGSLDLTGSLNQIGSYTHTGSVFHTGSKFLDGIFVQTGSLSITGSTTQIGNNTLLGNTILSGSIIISGSTTVPSTPTIKVYGDMETNGVIKFMPVSKNIDTSISASYIYVSGSTNDLYFSQNGAGYNNVTRLRWLEGNLYTGLLHGGLITTQSSTTYQISSGSGIIVDLNATLGDDPFPVIQFLEWGNLSASIAPLTASYQQAFVGIDATNNIFAQGTPFNNGQFDSVINIGTVLFQNQSTINGVKTQPSVAYGFEQQQNTFNRAFGPLKLSGYTLTPSGSSTGSLIVSSGTAYAPGSNYTIDPNESYYSVDNGTNISKIFRYYQSGSSWVYLSNAGAGYTTIDPTQYSNNGTLSSVGAGNWSIQRVFWFPNSVTKAIVVYYGNAVYPTEAEALANISFESFVEAPNTAANAIYLGAIIINQNGVFTSPNTFTIYPGGLFRQVGGSGGGGSIITQTLSGLSDVSISGPTNGQPLVYNNTSAKWQNSSTLIADLTGNASTATTASYTLTASYVENAQTASYVLNAISASFATLAQTANTASYVVTAQTASYVLQAVSASYATLAQTANTASYVVTAQTASYVLNAVSASFATTASYSNTSTSASYALSASYAPSTPAFPYNGNAQISGSLGVTGSFTTQTWDGASYVSALSFTDVRRGIFDVMGGDSIDADARDLYDSAAVNSINWDVRRLLDSTGVASIYWDLRSAYDAVASQSIAWDSRLLKIDNGPGAYTVNWGSGILRDTGAKNSVDWENRTTIDTGNKNSIDWQNRQLKNTSATEVLNWQSGVTITGAATVTGSLELTGSFKVQGAGNGFTGPFPAIEVDDVNFSRKLYDFNAGSSSIDFGNRALTTANGTPAISWNGTTGTYDTSLYQAQRIDSVTRGNLYSFNSLGGQILDESYFDATVSSDELVYLNTDGQWYQVDQTTDSSTKMLGIAKNVFSQTGSVLIEGDVVVSTGGGYPSVNGAGYGLPIYIRESGGTLMSTTIPTTGYVRLLGHCYYTPYAGASEWIMKFRPSHEWIEL